MLACKNDPIAFCIGAFTILDGDTCTVGYPKPLKLRGLSLLAVGFMRRYYLSF
jgi:hypothetical protein